MIPFVSWKSGNPDISTFGKIDKEVNEKDKMVRNNSIKDM